MSMLINGTVKNHARLRMAPFCAHGFEGHSFARNFYGIPYNTTVFDKDADF